MMPPRLPFAFPAVLLLCILLGCTSVKLRNANSYYEEFAFADAIKNYEAVLAKKTDFDAMTRLADCYRQTENSEKAEYWYGQIAKLKESLPVHKYYYAEALMTNGKYSEAKKWFAVYLNTNASDERARRLMQSCDSVSSFSSDSLLFEISLLPLNNCNCSNFSPAFYRSGIVYVSDRGAPGKSKSKSYWTGREYYDLFYAKKTEKGNWLDPEILRGNINGNLNEGPATFSRDFNTIYFTRNDYLDKQVNKSKKSFNNLKIFKGNFIEGLWNITSDLPFNNSEYSTAHPSLNESGNTLYFVSDMPWGYGGTDIYMVKYINGRWTNPQNLGSKINTSGNELFPFISADSVLYFASDGLHGLGGLDIYMSVYSKDEWSAPLNLGYPVNTSKNDFGFILHPDGRHGYLTSNRKSNFDQIYSFVKNDPDIFLHGLIKDAADQKPLAKATVQLNFGGKDTVLSSDGEGKFSVKLKPNETCSLGIEKTGYFKRKETFQTGGAYKSYSMNSEYALEKISVGKSYRFYSITFTKGTADAASSSLPVLDSLVNWMNLNAGLNIEIACHTDSRGNDKDNLALSQKRADALADYFSLKGIPPRRISSVGMGETKLLNHCVNGILCLEEDHAVNNRVEIKITAAN